MRLSGCMCLTSSVTVLLVAAVHAVRISITPPAERDTVTVLTLKLVIITLHITAVLRDTHIENLFTIYEGSYYKENTSVKYNYVCVPHQIHQRSHGLHHTSIGQRYSDRWCKRTRS